MVGAGTGRAGRVMGCLRCGELAAAAQRPIAVVGEIIADLAMVER